MVSGGKTVNLDERGALVANYVQRMILGGELRKLRDEAGLTLIRVEEELEIEQSFLSRVERGDRGMRARDVRALLDLYGRTAVIDDLQRDELLALARQSIGGKPDWWRSQAGLKPRFDLLLAAESGARTINAFYSQVVPGLLQTEAYAREVIQATDLEGGVDVEERIAVRRARQEILTRAEDPVMLQVVIDEAVLRHRVGGVDVMREQLRHLVEVNKRPNVTLQVLPFAAGAHPAITGDFVLMLFRADGDIGMVYTETATSGLVLQGEAEIRRYIRTYGVLEAKALTPTRSTALIGSVIKELDGK
jgi:transcriptional regulator with XRE-family HTH domain